MIKTVLRCIFFIAAVIIAGSVIFGSAADICAQIYEPNSADVFEYGEIPSEIYSLTDGRVMVLGKYTSGAKAGFEYFKIYNKSGMCEARGSFNIQGATLTLSQIVFTDKYIIFPATAEMRNGGGKSVVAFFMDYEGNPVKTVTFSASDSEGNIVEGLESGFERIVCADREEGSRFVAISGSKMAVFDADGKYLFSVFPEFVAQIRDVILSDDTYIAVGCDTNNSLGRVFDSVYCGFFNETGMVKETKFLEEDGISACCFNILQDGEKFLLYGKYLKNTAETGEWRSVSELDGMFAFDGSFRFHIGTDENEADTSFFFMEMDKEGTGGKCIRYTPEGTDVMPYVAAFLNTDDGVTPALVTYYADSAKADTYELTYTLPDFDREVSDVRTYTVPSDTYILCTTDVATGGVYLYNWIKDSGQYKMCYFTSGARASSALKKMRQAMPVREKLTEIKEYFPFFISLYFMMTFCLAGAARGKKRR